MRSKAGSESGANENAGETGRGVPYPLGTSVLADGVNFAILATGKAGGTLRLFPHEREADGKQRAGQGGARAVREITLDKASRTGDVWHVFVRDLKPGTEYVWRFTDEDGSETPDLIDPWSRRITGGEEWGDANKQYRSVVIPPETSLPHFERPHHELRDLVIYELHVRGFTKHESAGALHPGTYLGLTEKIPYLKDLGVTAVELLPVAEFDETDNPRSDPETGDRLFDFWGYNPIHFLSPKASYASDSANPIDEFREMVRRFHEAGIEVILDVVFNHTGEGNERGRTTSFRGLAEDSYYAFDDDEYRNHSGCGNTFICSQKPGKDLILHTLRYWYAEMGVDGFRFDIAPILAEAPEGGIELKPAILREMKNDPILSHARLIAEPWGPAGLYLVGRFPSWGPWSEWNDRFRDQIRGFVRGDAGSVSELATRLTGSSDLYGAYESGALCSVNFAACHDGFTLRDIVSYEKKWNLQNGEENRDGHNHNVSANHGIEGETDSAEIIRLRGKQMKNLLSIVLLARGIPLILAGDEFGRTQRGNNNAYCQDNETTWVDWSLVEEYEDLRRFVKCLIAFRLKHPALRGLEHTPHGDESIQWLGADGRSPVWEDPTETLGLHLTTENEKREILMIFHHGIENVDFKIPPPAAGRQWHLLSDTSAESPDDFHEEGAMPPIKRDARTALVRAQSTLVLVALRT